MILTSFNVWWLANHEQAIRERERARERRRMMAVMPTAVDKPSSDFEGATE